MSLRLLLPALFVAGGAIGFASTPVARVISAEPVEVDGITAPARNYVPVGLGGEVTTRSNTALIQFPDGGSILVQPNSKVLIGGKAESPQVSVIRGSAQYKLHSGSQVHMVSGGGAGAGKLADDVIMQASLTANPLSPLAEASASRFALAGQPTGVIPPSVPVAGGGFAVAPITTGTFVSNAGGGGTGLSIVTPGGLTINLSAVTNPNTGAVTYVVASISQVVTGSNGVQVTVSVTSGNSLIGATVPTITPTTTSGSTVAVSFIPPGQTTPLTPSQAAQTVQTGISQAVTTAIQSGALPAGTAAPSPSPVSTGTFSSTAP